VKQCLIATMLHVNDCFR